MLSVGCVRPLDERDKGFQALRVTRDSYNFHIVEYYNIIVPREYKYHTVAL